MRALILFIHIVGVLILFAGLAMESVGLRQLRRSASVGDATPWIALFLLVLRLYPAALAILLLTGGYLASNVGVWQFGWVRISMATLVIITIVGVIAGLRVRALYRRSLKRAHASGLVDGRFGAPWLPALLGSRGAAALGVVYVMVAKPDGVPAFMVIVTAAVFAAAIARVLARLPANAATAASRGSDDIGDYAATNHQEA